MSYMSNMTLYIILSYIMEVGNNLQLDQEHQLFPFHQGGHEHPKSKHMERVTE